MIIDFHTHYYPDKIVERALSSVQGLLEPATDGTRAGLEASMKRAGIDLSVALPLVNTPRNSRGVNHWALAENRPPIRMLGSIHPEDPEIMKALEWIAESGLPGVKVHPEYQHFRFSEERFFPVWEKCAQLGLFVLTHAGSDIKFSPPFQTNPAELAAFHRRFPTLKLVLAHLGGMDMWDEVEKELLGLPVYLDLAMIGDFNVGAERLVRMIRRHGAERVLFGTDSPWLDQKRSVDFVRSLPLSETEKEQIFYRNAAGLLRLDVR